MNCRICKTKFNNNDVAKQAVISAFDDESKICRPCKMTEEVIRTDSDERIRHEVHFAYTVKNFKLWRKVVLLNRGHGEECLEELVY
jgi:hypothetical protein